MGLAALLGLGATGCVSKWDSPYPTEWSVPLSPDSPTSIGATPAEILRTVNDHGELVLLFRPIDDDGSAVPEEMRVTVSAESFRWATTDDASNPRFSDEETVPGALLWVLVNATLRGDIRADGSLTIVARANAVDRIWVDGYFPDAEPPAWFGEPTGAVRFGFPYPAPGDPSSLNDGRTGSWVFPEAWMGDESRIYVTEDPVVGRAGTL